MYKIVRVYRDHPGRTRTLQRSLTLEEAQAHCNNPETSSTTATGRIARAVTRRMGPWFDSYTREDR